MNLPDAAMISEVFRAQLLPMLAAMTRPVAQGQVVRVEAHVPPLDGLGWLRSQTHPVKTYWSDREQSFVMAGVGVAAEQRADAGTSSADLIGRLRRDLTSASRNARYYGGLRFDGHTAADARWQGFGAYRFVIPRVELGSKGNQHYAACNVLVEEGARPSASVGELKEFVEALRGVEDAGARVPKSISRRDRPDRAEWEMRVNDLLQCFREGRAEKVVLARESFYEFEEALDPLSLLSRLMRSTGYSFHFCFQLAPSLAFLGASPERLYKRLNTHLQSESLAGTRSRGESPEEDDSLGRELLRNEKERREHTYVVEHVRKVFDETCRAVRDDSAPELLVLRHCQHLVSRIEGMLHHADVDDELLRKLHPTPAVGGAPTETALDLINALEPFDRGWYAGPVGYVGYDTTEFAVAIRSGLAVDNTLCLYSGAGIVEGSAPEEEWDEIENKMENFMNIIERGRQATIQYGR